MAAGAFYQDTALQQSARGTLEPVYLSQTVWSCESAILAASETGRSSWQPVYPTGVTKLSVTNKPARVPLALCLRVQYRTDGQTDGQTDRRTELL